MTVVPVLRRRRQATSLADEELLVVERLSLGVLARLDGSGGREIHCLDASRPGYWWARARRILVRRVERDAEAQAAAASRAVEATERLWPTLARVLAPAARAFFEDEAATHPIKQRLAHLVETRLSVYLTAAAVGRAAGRHVRLVAEDGLLSRIVDAAGSMDPAVTIVPPAWGPPARLAAWAAAAVWMFLPAIFAITRGVTRFPRRPVPCKVVLLNWWGAGRPTPFDSLFLVDGRDLRPEDVLVIIVRRPPVFPDHIHQYRTAGVRYVDPADLRMPVAVLRETLGRARRAAAIIARWHGDNWTLAMARGIAGLMREAIWWEILLAHQTIPVLLCQEEHTPLDAVRTIVIERHGGKTVWLPHSHLLRHGAGSAYFHYTVLAASGSYLKEAYGTTWSRNMQIRSVGLFTNDYVGPAYAHAAAPGVSELLHRLSPQYRLLAVFSGAYRPRPSTVARYQRLIRLLLDLERTDDEVTILIKPKGGGHHVFLRQPPFVDLLRPALSSGRIVILDPDDPGYACTPQFLAERCRASLSMAGDNAPIGSVWVEALMLGRPSFAYDPGPFFHAPLLDEFEGTLIFREPQPLIEAIEGALRNEWNPPHPERLRALFDPFCDYRARERLRALVLDRTPVASPAAEAPVPGR